MKEIHKDGLWLVNGTLTVDMSLWTTQALLAEKLGVDRNVINNRVRRYMANGTLKTYYIEHLGIRLVPNVHEISQLGGRQKKQ